MIDLTLPHFNDPEAARRYIEAERWPNGPICPWCKRTDKVYAVAKKHHYSCKKCKMIFSVKSRTVMRHSPLPLHKWLRYFLLFDTNCTKSLSRLLEIAHPTSSRMAARIRERITGKPTPRKLRRRFDNRPRRGRPKKVVEIAQTKTTG
jgi:transposase-like protein